MVMLSDYDHNRQWIYIWPYWMCWNVSVLAITNKLYTEQNGLSTIALGGAVIGVQIFYDLGVSFITQ